MLEVMIKIVFLKSTVRPWESVIRPSSSTCSNTLKTSGCAFSISSKSTTEYGHECHYNTIKNCKLGPNVAAEHVDIKEYTIGTTVENCTFDGTGMSGENSAKSFINIKGNDCVIRNNIGYRNGCTAIQRAFEQNDVVEGWGQNATVYGN